MLGDTGSRQILNGIFDFHKILALPQGDHHHLFCALLHLGQWCCPAIELQDGSCHLPLLRASAMAWVSPRRPT